MQISQCWTDELPYADTLKLLCDLARSHAREGGVHGSNLLALLDKEDFAGLCTYNLDLTSPDWDVLQLYHCRQAIAFFKKLECLDLGVDKEKAAFEKFKAAELSCRTSNDLFRSYARGLVNLRPRDVRLLEAVRRKIASVLGRCPSLSELDMTFGPGATTATKKPEACPTMKMAAGLQCSADLVASGLLPSLLRELPHLMVEYCEGEDVEGSVEDGQLVFYTTSRISVQIHDARLEFVPKSATTFRTITVEPMLNTLLQAGIRKWMKRRLSRAGIDLSDQTKNQRLAKEGSITGELATLDLASASDTISYSLVKLLLPEDWFRLLNAARSSTVNYRGSSFALEKFSAMGNATTFPLESLIFWAITTSACEGEGGQIGIYGDDIICPVSRVTSVVRALNFCGFEVSSSKSFWSGPFRESCGADFYKGFSVRPYYQKEPISGRSLFVLHNFYFRAMMFDYADFVRELIPPTLRIFGPDGYGDGHLLGEWSPLRSRKLREKGYCGVSFETFSLRGRKIRPPFAGDWISPLYSIYTRAREDLLPVFIYAGGPLGDRAVSVPLGESPPVDMDKGGYPIWVVPGSDGYERRKIYTFCT